MNKEKFNPVKKATQLVSLAHGVGWQEKHLLLAQELLTNHSPDLKGTRVTVKKGRKKVELTEALAQSLRTYEELYSAQPDRKPSIVDEFKRREQKRKARKEEARRRELHLLSWTDPLEPGMAFLPRDDLGPPVKSLVFADDPGNFLTRIYDLRRRELGRVIVLVEGKERAEAAISILKLTPEKSLPERVFFIGIVADEEEIGPTKESLSAKLEDSPEKLIGVVPRGENLDELCANILMVLKEKFPPLDPDSLSQS